jgi:hypothetical protein
MIAHGVHLPMMLCASSLSEGWLLLHPVPVLVFHPHQEFHVRNLRNHYQKVWL